MLKFTSHSIKGKRAYQEDRISITDNLGYMNFAVIDGHGGDFVAELIKDELDKPNDVSWTVEEIFRILHQKVIQNHFPGGACLLLATVFKESGSFMVAWVGDCIACLRKENEVIQLNKIHGVYNENELKRIEEQTGKKPIIHNSYLMEDWRSGNGLMPTRSIGDINFTRAGVIPDPEIVRGKLNKGENLILITDGADNVSELSGSAEEIVDRAYKEGSEDNISTIVITLE